MSECAGPVEHPLVRTVICVSLIAFTVVIGVGVLTAGAIRLQGVAPTAPLCEAKSWLNQKCRPSQESTEVKTAEVVAPPKTEQSVEGSPQLIAAEQNREISVTAEAKETQYNVVSAQTSRAFVDAKAVVSGLDQPERPLATKKADAALKPLSPPPTRQEALRRPHAKKNDTRRSSVVARDTLYNVPVNIPDGTQRRIDVRPTSLQDVYYYSARQ
jgi:hypothetical protein